MPVAAPLDQPAVTRRRLLKPCVTLAVDAALIAARLRKLDGQVQPGGKAVDGALVPPDFDRASPTEALQHVAARDQDRFGEAPGFAAAN